ncbi:MAG: alpha-ketoglutarate-dependent dioxygenase AlkB [Balneolales bacterium]|nr:alpha-ketoglutarate-dependent dioxygenase AlkB [Balneolales bacterium]
MSLNLFDTEPRQVLTHDGSAIYYGVVFGQKTISDYYDYLLHHIPWKPDEVMMFGKKIVTRRKMAWYADDGISYTYSSSKKEALTWNPVLLELKNEVSRISGYSYNSCLLNLYHSGEEGMGWHADDEKELLDQGAIASVSFGATRKFAFKHRKDGSRADIILESGSLLVMKDETQRNWLHRLPPTKKVQTPRINLTFRTVLQQ